jgi:hypothetical protein
MWGDQGPSGVRVMDLLFLHFCPFRPMDLVFLTFWSNWPYGLSFFYLHNSILHDIHKTYNYIVQILNIIHTRHRSYMT